jgi:hypothetical protein
VVALNPAGVDVTVYSDTAAPPLSAGADHATINSPRFAVTLALTDSGAVGAIGIGVTLENATGVDWPRALLAATLKTYDTPFVRPVTVYDVDDVDIGVMLGLAVIM